MISLQDAVVALIIALANIIDDTFFSDQISSNSKSSRLRAHRASSSQRRSAVLASVQTLNAISTSKTRDKQALGSSAPLDVASGE